MVETPIITVFGRDGLNRLSTSIAFSIVLHLAGYAGVQAIQRSSFTLPRLPQLVRIALPTPVPPTVEPKVSLTFIAVDPATAQAAAPKNPKFYSTHATVATQPEPAKTKMDQPKVEGKKSELPRVVETRPPSEAPAASSPSPKPAPPETIAKVEPKPTPPKPQPQPLQPAPQPAPRPRTLAEAMAQRNPGALFAQKSAEQEGGAARVGRLAFDAVGTPFGMYDAKFIAAVQEQWHTSLRNRSVAPGRVVIDFRLHDDGRITNLRVAEKNVDDLLSYLCEQSILAPAPFERWPKSMRESIGAPHRDVRFTFHYN